MRNCATGLVWLVVAVLLMGRDGWVEAAAPSRSNAYEYNRSAPLDFKQASDIKQGEVTVREITFAAARGGRTQAYLVVPPGKGPFAGVLWVHWMGPPEASNRTEFLNEAVELAKSGVVSLLVDALWAAPNKFPWTGQDEAKDRAVSVRQVVELRRAIDVLMAQPMVDGKRLGYVGHDFGAMSGGELSGVDQRIKAYVLMAGSPRYTYWFFHWSPLKGAAREAYAKKMEAVDPINFVKQATPAALYFQFSKGKDDWCPERQAQEFFEAASEPKKISWYECGHGMDVAEAVQDRSEWIRGQLGVH